MKTRQPRPPFEILAPESWLAPAVFNSPHSGREYQEQFLRQSRLAPATLRKSEDCFVDDLFLGCVGCGAPMLRAHVPRSFVDLNREPYELDPRMFDSELPGYANTGSPRVAGGLGTIPRLVAEGEEIYRGKLRVNEAFSRIERIYRPYHKALSALIDEVMGKNGAMLLIDCHSMPSTALAHVHPAPRGHVDVVLGDRYGASCSEEITSLFEELLKAEGLSTLRNKPYAGGFITHSHGAPRLGRHALQIEIDRRLYLNEATCEKSAGFTPLRDALDRVIAALLRELEALLAPRRMAAE